MDLATNDEPELKICGSCSEAFGCGAKLDMCWCSQVTISISAADDLKERFVDCLCPQCLSLQAESLP